MRKLNLDHLAVESFETVSAGTPSQGTVHAHQQTCPCEHTCAASCNGTCVDPTCPCAYTCAHSCDGTCYEASCVSCWFTCAADCTMDSSCMKTCYGRTCAA
jgi:hypothetical protein